MPVTLHPDHAATALAQETRSHPSTRLREARILQLLVADGYGARDIAGLTGLDEGRVRESLSLLVLPTAAQEAMDAGRLPVGLALGLARLTEGNRCIVLGRWLAGGFRDARHASRYVATVLRDEAGL